MRFRNGPKRTRVPVHALARSGRRHVPRREARMERGRFYRRKDGQLPRCLPQHRASRLAGTVQESIPALGEAAKN